MRGDKVVIEVGLNEATMRAANPHVPYAPDEIAADARRCADAGASVVHFHARDAMTGALRFTDVDLNVETMRRITASTRLIAYPTYGEAARIFDYYDVNRPVAEGYGHIAACVGHPDVRLEVAPVDLGALDANGYVDPRTGCLVPSNVVVLNSGRDHEWMLQFCAAHGLTPTFTAFDAGHVRNLRNLIAWGWVTREPIVLKLFFGGRLLPFGLAATKRGLDFYLEETRDLSCRWMAVTYGDDQFPMVRLALARGGDVRVGVGDYPYAERGAPSNAELVQEVVRLARACGREPATADETRELWDVTRARACGCPT
ncbi:MAG: 3-keto-5-aminohexanoate cleavage protein [Candidatus Binatia bacterium]